MTILRGVLGVGVLGCIAASCFFAFEFGWTRGASELTAWGFALVALFLDLLKAGLPLLASQAADPGQKRGCWVAFFFLTGMSLWCAYGMTAAQLADRMAARTVAAGEKQDRQAALERLQKQRAMVPSFSPTTQAAVDAAKQASETAKTQREAECDKRGERCRAREADERDSLEKLAKAQAAKGITDQAAALDARIDAAEKALAAVDVKTAIRQVDPQTENMARAIGWSQDTIALLSHAIFAISVEIGSGLGFWLVFGHGRAPPPVRNDVTTPAPREPLPAPETPADARERFFREVVIPCQGGRLTGTQVYLAYAAWCRDHKLEPISPHVFGRDPPWTKERIGGTVWYLDAQLAGAYAGPALHVVA